MKWTYILSKTSFFPPRVFLSRFPSLCYLVFSPITLVYAQPIINETTVVRRRRTYLFAAFSLIAARRNSTNTNSGLSRLLLLLLLTTGLSPRCVPFARTAPSRVLVCVFMCCSPGKRLNCDISYSRHRQQVARL